MIMSMIENAVDLDDDLDEEMIEDQEEGSGDSSDNGTQNVPDNNNDDNQSENKDESPKDFVSLYLNQIGIQDRDKIKFEDEYGVIKEVSWDDLTDEEKVNVLKSGSQLDVRDDEIAFLNDIRTKGLSTNEYLDYIKKETIDEFLNNQQQKSYNIDSYNDDELFVLDAMARSPEMSEDEAVEFMHAAKVNEDIYRKQVEAIRKSYQEKEDMIEQEQIEMETEEDRKLYNEYVGQIYDTIGSLDISGIDINMTQDEADELYEFMTGFDAAGHNNFEKMLSSDPKNFVKTAWFALNGERAIQDIVNYYESELNKLQAENKKTQKDLGKKGSDVVIRNNSSNEDDDDLDDF